MDLIELDGPASSLTICSTMVNGWSFVKSPVQEKYVLPIRHLLVRSHYLQYCVRVTGFGKILPLSWPRCFISEDLLPHTIDTTTPAQWGR